MNEENPSLKYNKDSYLVFMHAPKVTIIVPCFNHEKYIQECIDSIFKQTYKNIEVVVINDGSNDRSLEVLKKLNCRFNFKLIDQPNHGLLKTLNLALSSNDLGKYVCLLASDDYIPANRISLQVEVLEKNPVSVLAFGNYTEIGPDGKILEKIKMHPPKKDFFDELLLGNYIPAPTVMIRSEVFKEVGLYDLNFKIEDWYMWLKILKRFPHISYIDENLAFYRLHGANIHRDIEFITEESIKIINQYRDCKYYWSAYSLIRSKHIIKCFLTKWTSGFKALKDYFSLTLINDLVFCLLTNKGPFRKKKLKYKHW